MSILKLNNGWEIHYDLDCDLERKLVHVLDMGGPISLIDEIEHIQDHLAKHYQIVGSWRWIVYGTNKIPAEFIRNKGLFPVEESFLDPIYLEWMKNRR